MLDPEKSGHAHHMVRACSLILYLTFTGIALAVPGWNPDFTSDGVDISNNGVIVPAWQDDAPELTIFVLEQADNPAFDNAVERYRGTDRSAILTGFPEGTFYFRVRRANQDDAWSDVRKVEVKFIGRTTLITLLATGFIVVVAIVVAIFRGWKKERRIRA